MKKKIMKNKINKLSHHYMFFFATLAVVLLSGNLSCYAYSPSSEYTEQGSMAVNPRGEAIIQYVYRTYKGKVQYRRWNTKTKTWVDPYWIDL